MAGPGAILTPDQQWAADYAAALAGDDPAAQAPVAAPVGAPYDPYGVMGNVPQPAFEQLSQPPVAPAAPPQGGASGQGASVATSWSGTPVSDRQAAAGGLEGDYARADREAARQYGVGAQSVYDATQTQMDAVATPQQVAGAPTMLSATLAKQAAESRANSTMAAASAQFAMDEQAATAASQQVAAAAMAQYQSSVQEFQAMQVDPGQWWGNLGRGDQLGTLASVFVANFLGVKGIQTTVMPTINEAIDRNINAQLANIQKAGQAVGVFKDVWEMTLAQSATETEARLRIRGYALAQVEKEIQAELMRYDAPLAQAKAAEAVATIGQERMRLNQQLEQVVWGRAEQAKERAVGVYKANLDAAHQRASLRLQRDIFDAGEARANAAAAATVRPTDLFIDPRQGVAAGYFNHGLPDAKKVEIQEAAGAMRQAMKETAELNEMMREHGKTYAGPMSYSINSASGQAIIAKAKRVAYYAAYAKSGKQTAQKELEGFEKMYPVETWLTRDGVSGILNQRIQEMQGEWDTSYATFLREPETEAERQALEGYRVSGYAGPGVDYDAASREVAAKLDEYAKVFEAARAPDANEPASKVTPEAASTWEGIRENTSGKTPPKWFAKIDGMVRDARAAGDPEAVARAVKLVDGYRDIAERDGNGERVRAMEHFHFRLTKGLLVGGSGPSQFVPYNKHGTDVPADFSPQGQLDLEFDRQPAVPLDPENY